MTVLIAIDDTDNPDTIGTGRLSRMLAETLEQAALISAPSITRHQLLVHADIPYTSHNSAACIEARTENTDLDRILDKAIDFLLGNFHDGANPGLCVMEKEAVSDRLAAFGRRAQQEVLAIEEAHDLALGETGALVRWFGETGQGCIGAMSAVGLRSTGADGRFIGLAGIRDLTGQMTVGELLGRSGIMAVMTDQGMNLPPDEVVDTGDWVRPTLIRHQPVFVVTRKDNRWQPAEKRKKKATA